MRNFSLLLLLATAAAPAFAQDEGDSRAERRAERRAAAASEQSDNKPERAVRVMRQERQSSEQAPGALVRIRERPAADGDGPAASSGSEGNDTVRNWRRAQREAQGSGGAVVTGAQEQPGSLAPRQRRIRTIPDAQQSVTQKAGEAIQRHRRDYRDGNYTRWSRDRWRHDRRYDWRRHRDRNRSLFHLGFYYDPFGWNYRRYNIGWYLYPSYYSSRYWLHDPWYYRLPPAYGPYRWVRYWDDALLVNIYTGEVVDVIHNFFW